MKRIKTYSQYDQTNASVSSALNEAVTSGITAWHISSVAINSLSNRPMWFTPKIEWAKEYHKNAMSNANDKVFTYEVSITGNILTEEEASRLAKSKDVDFDDTIADLVTNPTEEEVLKVIEMFRPHCDGFFQWDYDPTDWGDGESILVFDPAKNVKIIKEI